MSTSKKSRKVWPYCLLVAVLIVLGYIFSPFTKEGQTTENNLPKPAEWNPMEATNEH